MLFQFVVVICHNILNVLLHSKVPFTVMDVKTKRPNDVIFSAFVISCDHLLYKVDITCLRSF